MKKILLSYTTINDLSVSPHSWLNKAMGIEKPTNEYMEKGKATHEKLQKVVLGDLNIVGINLPKFNAIEKHFQKNFNDKYTLHGYADAVNYATKTLLEVKSSQTTPKTMGEFDKLIQGKYYCYVSGFRKVLYVACTFDLSKLKTYLYEYENDDMQEVENWVMEAIATIETENFKSDLVNGKCELERCPYGENCYFK